MSPDIYSEKTAKKQHSLRYIKITGRNVVGILNRIASLMRRKRYNMEEVSVSFDNNNIAHFIIAIDERFLDVAQVISQLYKLHDIIDVYDATGRKNDLYNTFYVYVDDLEELDKFPLKADKRIKRKNGGKAIFIVSFKNTPRLVAFLNREKYTYVHRVLSLIPVSKEASQKYAKLYKKYQQK